MKSHSTTVLANALIALTKLMSAIALLQIPEARTRAIVPTTAVALLIVACVLISRHRWQGPLVALVVIGFFVLQFVMLGVASSMFAHFVLHALAFVANIATFRSLRQQATAPAQPPIG